MIYFDKISKVGIGTVYLPGRKNGSLVYIEGNREIIIGTVRDEVLFEKGVEALITRLETENNESGRSCQYY